MLSEVQKFGQLVHAANKPADWWEVHSKK